MDAYEQIEVIGRGSYGRFVCGIRRKEHCTMRAAALPWSSSTACCKATNPHRTCFASPPSPRSCLVQRCVGAAEEWQRLMCHQENQGRPCPGRRKGKLPALAVSGRGSSAASTVRVARAACGASQRPSKGAFVGVNCLANCCVFCASWHPPARKTGRGRALLFGMQQQHTIRRLLPPVLNPPPHLSYFQVEGMSKQEMKDVESEVDILRRLDHPNIIRMVAERCVGLHTHNISP